MKKGTLIVFEGTDGSGKSTQFARLCQRVDSLGKSYQRLRFPQYKEESSALIRMYLGGEFGKKPEEVNAYAATAFYAVDRYASLKKVWGNEYAQGGLILTDRYTTSNAIHQAVKCVPEERAEFFRWLDEFEYEKLGLPRPNLVLYLDMPTDTSVQLLRSRESKTKTEADIHEQDTAYLRACRICAQEAAQTYGWYRISCLDTQGNLRSIEDIHAEVWSQVEPLIKGTFNS